MRNKILRSANAKYHYSYLFFYRINKGDLPVFYGVNSSLQSVFFGCYCLTPVTLFIIRKKKMRKNNDVRRDLRVSLDSGSCCPIITPLLVKTDQRLFEKNSPKKGSQTFGITTHPSPRFLFITCKHFFVQPLYDISPIFLTSFHTQACSYVREVFLTPVQPFFPVLALSSYRFAILFIVTNELPLSRDLSRPFVPFSSVQFYGISQTYTSLFCFLSVIINTRFMELIGVFQNYLF